MPESRNHGSETKDLITHSTTSSVSISIFAPAPLVPKSPGAGWGGNVDGPRWIQHVQWDVLHEGNAKLREPRSFIMGSKPIPTLCPARGDLPKWFSINILEKIVPNKGQSVPQSQDVGNVSNPWGNCLPIHGNFNYDSPKVETAQGQ